MYSPRRSHRHKYGQPHIRALSPHTLQVSHGTAPDFLNGLNKHVFSLMAAWLSVFSKMTGQEILIWKNWRSGIAPQRSLYFPQTFVGTGDAPSSSWSPFFQGTVPWEPIGWLGGDRLQRSNLLEWHLGSKERDVAGWESYVCNGHMSLGGSFHIRSQPSFSHVGHGSVPYDRLAWTLVGSV